MKKMSRMAICVDGGGHLCCTFRKMFLMFTSFNLFYLLSCCSAAVYHVECTNLPEVPEGDWFCATCAERPTAGEPRSSSCSSSGTSSIVNGVRTGAISCSDGRWRVVESRENGSGGSSTNALTRAPLSMTISSDVKACGGSSVAGAGTGGELDKAAGINQSETSSKATKKGKMKNPFPSRKVGGGAMLRVVEPRGLERVPIRLGIARPAAGTANMSLGGCDSSIATSMEQVLSTSGPGPGPGFLAPETAGVQVEELPNTSTMVDACKSDDANQPADVAINDVTPTMATCEAVERVQPADGLCPSLDTATPVHDRAQVRVLASAASSSMPMAATSQILAGVEQDSVAHEQLDEGAAVEVDVGSIPEVGMGLENTEASWQCRCCNRRNCGKDGRCRECGASRPMGGGARAARRDGKRSRTSTTVQPPWVRTSERLKTTIARAPSPAPALSPVTKAVASPKKTREGSAPLLTPWSCRACATYNKNRWKCSTCGTRLEPKAVEEGKPEWWCCSSCSRFNSRSQDGNRCRFCRFAASSEEDEEVISVGEEEDFPPVLSNGGSERIPIRLPSA